MEKILHGPNYTGPNSLSVGFVFFVKMLITNSWQNLFWTCWTIRRVLGVTKWHCMGYTRCLPPDLGTPTCSADLRVLTRGRWWPGTLVRAAWTSWWYTGWSTAAPVSWGCGSAASSVGTKGAGKGRTQPTPLHLQWAELRSQSSWSQPWYSSRIQLHLQLSRGV